MRKAILYFGMGVDMRKQSGLMTNTSSSFKGTEGADTACLLVSITTSSMPKLATLLQKLAENLNATAEAQQLLPRLTSLVHIVGVSTRPQQRPRTLQPTSTGTGGQVCFTCLLTTAVACNCLPGRPGVGHS
jgi:hypothetical protein